MTSSSSPAKARRNTRTRILIIDGHPDEQSLCAELAQAYRRGAASSGAEVRVLLVRALAFNPNLAHGYRERTELEPDLLHAQELIRWAEHLVVVHPVWWGGLPALLKGFFDRTFLPGFFFRKQPGSSTSWEKLLRGRSARIVYTLDTPRLLWWLAGRPSYMALKYVTLGYCGIAPIRGTAFGVVRLSTPEQRQRWLTTTEQLGRQRA